MMIAVDQSKERVKVREHQSFHVGLANERVPIYEKADKDSKILGHVPEGVKRIDTDFSVHGHDGDNR